MKKRRFLFTLSLIIGITKFALSQGPIYLAPNILPPGPTAAELGKYGRVPINLSTGAVNLDIPLLTLKSKNLACPVSLSYYTTGVKVDEVASWVGMGWSLNAGGGYYQDRERQSR